MLKYILLAILYAGAAFAQDQFSVRFKGTDINGTAVLIVSNRNPVFREINDVVDDLVRKDYRVGISPSDYYIDLAGINKENNPFGADVQYIVKINVHNQMPSEQSIKTTVEVLNVEDGKTFLHVCCVISVTLQSIWGMFPYSAFILCSNINTKNSYVLVLAHGS